MINSKYYRVLFILSLALSLLGCSVAQIESEPVALPTIQPTSSAPTPTLNVPINQPTVVIVATELPPPVEQVVNEPTPPPVAEPDPITETVEPVESRVDLMLHAGMSRNEILSWILAERAAGQTIQQVAADLHAAALLFDVDANPLYAHGGRAFAEVDVRGDGIPLWSFSLYRWQDGGNPIIEAWLISVDELVHVQTEADAISPALLLLDSDFTGDGIVDIVYQQMNCGAHTCFGTYQMYSYHAGPFVSILDSSTAFARRIHQTGIWVGYDPERPDTLNMSLPTITQVVLPEHPHPGLQFRGGMVGSVGAGVHQGFVQQWVWDGQAMVLASLTIDHTGYRHHELYDGNFAYSLGERDLAISHYQRVIFDDTLNDNYTMDDELFGTKEMAQQIAAFRLLQLPHTWQERWLTYLQTNFPESAVTIAASLYQEAIENGYSAEDACVDVASYLESQPEPTGIFNGGLGYSNPVIDAANLCQPFTTDVVEWQRPLVHTELVRSGNGMVDAVIAAVLSKDGVALGQLAQPIDRPCSASGEPFMVQCDEGEADGTPVPTLLMGHCEGYLLRVDDPSTLDFTDSLQSVIGLYGVVHDARTGSYAVIFATEAAMGDLTLLVDDDGVHTFIWFGCASVGERFTENMPGDVLVVPPEPTGRSLRGY